MAKKKAITKRKTDFDKFKEYVSWCKENGVEHFKIGEIEGIINPYHLNKPESPDFPEMDDVDAKADPDIDLNEVDDDLLFHSA